MDIKGALGTTRLMGREDPIPTPIEAVFGARVVNLSSGKLENYIQRALFHTWFSCISGFLGLGHPHNYRQRSMFYLSVLSRISLIAVGRTYLAVSSTSTRKKCHTLISLTESHGQ